MNRKKTDAWEAAEWEYSDIQAARMMPLPGMSLSPDEITQRLAEIVRACPKFYPAVLELGIRRLAAGAGHAEEKRILKGLRLMLQVGDPEDLDEEVDRLIDNLENIWRFDVGQRCLELLVERHPQKGQFRDYLAHAMAKLGDVTGALQQASQAVAMAPDNPFFRCNLGLFHLMAGNAPDAEGERGVIVSNLDKESPLRKLWVEIKSRAFPGSTSNHHLGTLLGLWLAAAIVCGLMVYYAWLSAK